MSYTAARELVYLPEMNSVNLNDTIYVPNMAVLVSKIPVTFYESIQQLHRRTMLNCDKEVFILN